LAHVVVRLLRSAMGEGDDAMLRSTRSLTLQALSTQRFACLRCESNKSAFRSISDGPELLVALLRRDVADADVQIQGLQLVRALSCADDSRKSFAGAHDAARAFASLDLIEHALAMVTAHAAERRVPAAALFALKQLAINDANVRQIAQLNGLELVVTSLRTCPDSDRETRRAAAALMRNICGNDEFKTTLCGNGALELLLLGMTTCADDRFLCEQGAACLAQMALRSPTNAARIHGADGVSVVLRAMQAFPDAAGLQRHGALLIRNMVARSPELREPILGLGAEVALRTAGRLQACVDEAYGALRDLHCDVGMVAVDAAGQVSSAVETFGAQRPNFNPVFEGSDGLEDAVRSAQQPASSLFSF
jgi:hypothetical protein